MKNFTYGKGRTGLTYSLLPDSEKHTSGQSGTLQQAAMKSRTAGNDSWQQAAMKCRTALMGFLLLTAFLFSGLTAGAFEFHASDWRIISENTTDGYAVLDIDRYDEGNHIENYLYLEAQINGEWIWIYEIYHYFNPGNMYSHSTNPDFYVNIGRVYYQQTLDSDGDGDMSEYLTRLTIRVSPTGVYNVPVSMRFREVDGESFNTPLYFTLTFYKPSAPLNFNVSQNSCNQLNLSWTAPANVRSNGTNVYEVFRNGSFLGTATGLTYSDNTVTDGTSYNYKVRMRTTYNSINNYGEFTNEMAGSSKSVPVAPTNLSATTDRCDGKIRVTWQWSAETPVNYEIQRATTEGGTYTVISSTLPGDRTYYEDTPPAQKTTYYYKVRAKNNCADWGALSSAASGSAPAGPIAPTNIAYTTTSSSITVTWTDNSTDETGFVLTKVNLKTGTINDINLGSNTTSYTDNAVEMCVPYSYKVKSVNSCGSSAQVVLSQVILGPNLANTFPANSFKASKGYYPDIVHLEWNNNNRHLIDLFYIYRKVYGTTESTLIATVSGAITNFEDRYASNNVIYEYTIKGEGFCNDQSVFSNEISSIGFKVPTANVSGKVTYRDDNPVPNVAITAESTQLPAFSSVGLDGSTSYMLVGNLPEALPAFTFQAFVRFDVIKNCAIFNRGAQYKLNYSSNAFVFNVGGNTLTVAHTTEAEKFYHLTAVYDGSASYLYIDGVLAGTKTGVAAPANSTYSLVLGKDNTSLFLDGNIDEVRLWNTALTADDVTNNFDKYLNGNEPGLIGYYRLNENVAVNMFFDMSRVGSTYNERHGQLVNASFSTIIPTIEQLWFRTTTDATGNYLITGIPYLSGGSIYRIVPMMAPHEFNPSYKTLFVGDGATAHNNIDFVDISTVTVTVNVFYNNTNFPVKGVYVKLDGKVQIDKNEQIVQTNESGTVDLQVPFGMHYLSFEKQNHTFEEAYYPGVTQDGNIMRHNFNQPLLVSITDITRVKLAGKIVGGPVEAEKDLLSKTNPTKNNLGVVTINLTTERGFNIELDDNGDPIDATPKIVTATTNASTGYFEFELLPEKYKPVNSQSIKNSLYTFSSDADLALIDMGAHPILMYETDSIFVNKVFTGFDTTASYNLRRDWIYRSTPDFSVQNAKGGNIISHEKFGWSDGETTDSITLAVETGGVVTYPFGKPIFLFGNEYKLVMNAFEEYISADGGAVDRVAVTDGTLMISNNLAMDEKVVELELDEEGKAEYSFMADFPNIVDPYTKNLNISFKAGTTIVQWPAAGPFEAYILGGVPTGNNFVTTGPNVVDYILRDPPGSASSATLAKGFVSANSVAWAVNNATDASVSLAYQMGVRFAVSAGSPFFMVHNEFETDNYIKGGISTSLAGGRGIQQTTSLSFNESFSTSDDPLFVGAQGDVFIGHSTNIVYGLSQMIEIMPTTEVKEGEVPIATSNNYAISTKSGLRVNPEFDTYFILSQKIIEMENLPHLLKLRNLMLNKPCYTKVFQDINDPKYGANNDDGEVWGAAASTDIYSGPSYIFDTNPANGIDSVRYFNEQIANWTELLALNEQQKLNALADEEHRNISFGAGSVYQSSIGSEDNETGKTTFGFTIAEEIALSLGFSLNKFGFRLEGSVKNTTAYTKEWNTSETTTTNIGYTLSDQDPYNYLTVDVMKCQSGNGPVFKTRGGQTSCPYEGEHLTQYYEPGNHTLSFATMRIEGMKIAVANPISPLVPETAPALFTVYLTNESQAEKDGWYIFGVDVASNPYGAKVKMDGSTINDGVAVYVPYGVTVIKTIEVWKGRNDVNEYEDIYLYLGSTCEYVWDEVTISAYFASACTPVDFDFPGNGWVVNVNDDDELLIKIKGFNLQHEGFQDIHFQYAPSGTTNWTTTHIFTNDPTVPLNEQTTYINGNTSLDYYWDMSSLPDREYDIRLVTHCENGTVNYSDVLKGILDGQRPQLFGTPQPADGILDIDDNISIQFNEPIETGLLTIQNFDLKGSLNNYDIDHQAFLRFNGAGDYASLTEGLSFNDKSFTIEFWMRPSSYVNSVIFSQGSDPATCLEIGIKDADHVYFKIGGTEYVAAFIFPSEVPRTSWQHMAFVFDYEHGDILIVQNNDILLQVSETQGIVNTSGKIYIGRSASQTPGYFAGDLHDMRIWTKIWSKGDIYAGQYAPLTGNEIALYAYWPMNDARGTLAVDKAASRHLDVMATWKVEPAGSSWNFAGNNYLSFYSGYFGIIPDMDYTIEFWFRSDHPAANACLFSNQKGDGTDGDGDLDKALSIYATPLGKIIVASKGYTFEASATDVCDNKWHHFALVVRRRGNATSLIDGVVQNEKENTLLGGLAGSTMYIGVRKWDNTAGTGEDSYFTGKIDEFRIWNLARTKTQLLLDMNAKLHGTEAGLMAYFPFEKYQVNNYGNEEMVNSLKNQCPDKTATDAVPVTVGAFSSDAPNIKDARPLESIAFDFVAANNQIIITPKGHLMPQLEKNILEITVSGVEDRYGNTLASPVTWTAYIHRNQVRWEDEYRVFAKEVYQPLEFTATIRNTGGQQIGFSLVNLPVWLTAVPTAGVLNPESTLQVTFTVNPALNIGEYKEDIVLRTENGFDEKLPVTVRVYKKPPQWSIDPSRFEASMNFVGTIKINGVISSDIFDMVAAFKFGTDSIRGVAHLRYMEEFDSYIVFLTVYGTDAEALEFRLWDASAGMILDNAKPYNVTLTDHGISGTTRNPVVFESSASSRHYIVLDKGWNWVSFNKASTRMSSLSDFFWALEPANKDMIKTLSGYAMYNGASSSWSKGLTSVNYLTSYMMKMSKLDTIVFSGTTLVPESTPIPVATGWNYIGYIPDLTMSVKEALRMYKPSEDDIIKSQDGFAMYDNRVGWIGTLNVMQPGEGYMLKKNGAAGTFTYPNNTLLKVAPAENLLAAPAGWQMERDVYESNLSAVAKLDLSNAPELALNDQMVVGAFIDGTCHGMAVPLSNSGLEYDPCFMHVSNTLPGQMISFRLFDGMTGKTWSVKESLPYVPDGVFGTLDKPLILTLQSVLTGMGETGFNSFVRCYPNPFSERVTVEFSAPAGEVSIDVINMTGSLVRQLYRGLPVSGTNRVLWDGTNNAGSDVAPGIYYIRFRSAELSETVKITRID